MLKAQDTTHPSSPRTFHRSESLDAFLGDISANTSVAIRSLIVIGADSIGRDISRLLPDIAKLLQVPLPDDVHAALIEALQHAVAHAQAHPSQSGPVELPAIVEQPAPPASQRRHEDKVSSVGNDRQQPDTAHTAMNAPEGDPFDIGFEVDL